MNRINNLYSLLLVVMTIFSTNLAQGQQLFQNLNAYQVGAQINTGEYADIAWLGENSGPIALVAVGTVDNSLPKGLVTINDPDGNPMRFLEFEDGFNPIEGVAVDDAPNGDLVCAFYNAGVGASEVYRMNNHGSLIWGKRLPGIQVLDLKVNACVYSGGDGIWVTGTSTSNSKLAVEGLDAFGSQVFAREYDLTNSVFDMGATSGAEIEYDEDNQELVIIGTGENVTNGTDVMLFTRLNLYGNWLAGTSTFDPSFADLYKGASLYKDPQMGQYIVAFDYVTGGAQHFAACELDYYGDISWINYYPLPGGLFSTNYAKVNGIRHLGPSVLMGGYFTHSSGNSLAMTMAIDPTGGPMTITAYPIDGIYPTQSSAFMGMDLDPYTGFQYLAGNFQTPPTGGSWPQGPNPSSFYMVATDDIGNSSCHDDDFQSIVGLEPQVAGNDETHLNLPALATLTTQVDEVDILVASECAGNKRGFEEVVETQIEVIYHSDGAVELQLPAAEKGEFEIQLVDLRGQVLSTFTAQPGTVELPTKGLASGIYLVRFEGPANTGVQKIKIQH